jgi:hypothetical protein
MVAALAASRWRAAAGRVRDTLTGLATAIGVTGAIAGYPLWTQFFGPLLQHSSPFQPDFYKNDLAGFVQPSSLLLLHTRGSAAFAANFQGMLPEYLAYLGWPMLIALAFVAVRFWRLLAVRATVLTFVLLSVLSMGGTVLAGGHEHEAVTLPWYWLQTLPVTGSVIPDRFSIIADGAAAAAFAFGLDAAHTRWPRAEQLILGLASLAVVFLLPAPLPAAPVTALPAGWTETIGALRVPAGAHVLVVPIPQSSFTEPLRWQADTGEPGSMIGGYYMGPTYSGTAATDGDGLSSEAMYLNQLWAESEKISIAGLATLPVNQIYPDFPQMRGQLSGWKVSAVVAVTAVGSPLGRYLTGLLGRPAAADGGVVGWRTADLGAG